jgi:histone-lysine N-methyltransferase SETMAR
MATIFWDRKGPLLVNLLPRGDTISAAAYCETLKKLRWAIHNKRRGMVTRRVCLLQDNARLHIARATHELLQSFKWEVLPHPRHSPDLAPSDYHLFSKLKESLAGKTFQTMMRFKAR